MARIGLFSVSRLASGVMYLYEASQLITVNTTDTYHAVIGMLEGTEVEGLTFQASTTGAVTNTADNGGVLRCTDATHGLTTGQYITLDGMSDAAHNDLTSVTVIDPNTFDCDDIAYNSSGDSGEWSRGSALVVEPGHGGLFSATYGLSLTSSGNNKNYKFELARNASGLDEFASERRIAVASDLGNMSAGGLVKLNGGDHLWLQAKCTTDTTNFTIQHANVHINRL